MKKFKPRYLYWIIPVYLLFLFSQQYSVYTGAARTFENGISYLADVEEFDVKQIAAQSNGFVVIRFNPDNSKQITKRMSLTIQMAQQIMKENLIAIRYLPDSPQPIVMIPTYELQRKTSLANMAISGFSLLILLVVGFMFERFSGKKDRRQSVEFERIDA